MNSSSLPFRCAGSLEENVLLSKYTTFQLGGVCRGLIHCQTPEHLISTVRECVAAQKPFILIGGGSNLVVSDKGVDCYVIRYWSDKPLIEQDGSTLIVSGSTVLDQLVHFAADKELEGLNYASGIPGTVGGAIVGNAGAFGRQVGDVLTSAQLMDKDGKIFEVGPQDLNFSYRYSNLRKSGHIVVSARFGLNKGNKDELMSERNKILKTRREKHPDLAKEPCAGSFFRNVEPTSKAGKRQATGYFLEQAGGKELKHGGAYIFDKHANIIIKGANCSAQDVFELSKAMAALAKEKCDLDLIREVKFVGSFDGMDQPSSLFW